MEDFSAKEKCPGLTDRQYRELLNELLDEPQDEVLDEADDSADELLDGPRDEFSDSMDGAADGAGATDGFTGAGGYDTDADIEATYGDNAWQRIGKDFFAKPELIKRRAHSHEAKVKKQARTRTARLEIQRMAFQQDTVVLSDQIGDDNIRTLIALLVQQYTNRIERYQGFINGKLTKMLWGLIPQRLRNCATMFPGAMREYPGFLYQASEKYGDGKTFWATPDIPCYFEQNTECERLRCVQGYRLVLDVIDRHVLNYHKAQEDRAKAEITAARTIKNKAIYTYYDLLKHKPEWFEILFNYLKTKKEQNGNN